MHNCEEFRERITEYIIDRDDIATDLRFRHEFLICPDCAEFYADSCEMMTALASVDAAVGPVNVLADLMPAPHRHGRYNTPVLKWAAAVAALLVITAGLTRLPKPVINPPAQAATYVEQPLPLDPVTVDFLQQSELLLRNVVKLSPNDSADLADVKRIASEQLLAIDQRKDAAAQMPPVRDVMNTYETVLRDIRNVDAARAVDDVPDIQNRIQRNGLIANIKAFQPRVITVGYGGMTGN